MRIDKQIVDFALDIHKVASFGLEMSGNLAKDLSELGYRKASDVAREIFEEIKKLKHTKWDWTDVVEWDAIAELKKKYESEGEV